MALRPVLRLGLCPELRRELRLGLCPEPRLKRRRATSIEVLGSLTSEHFPVKQTSALSSQPFVQARRELDARGHADVSFATLLQFCADV
jgi:hypothetical protein